jgi:hypothetical protein
MNLDITGREDGSPYGQDIQSRRGEEGTPGTPLKLATPA